MEQAVFIQCRRFLDCYALAITSCVAATKRCVDLGGAIRSNQLRYTGLIWAVIIRLDVSSPKCRISGFLAGSAIDLVPHF